MKINLKITQLVMALTIVHFFGFGASMLLAIYKPGARGAIYYFLAVFQELTFAVMVVYLSSFLKYLGEKKMISKSVIIYLAVDSLLWLLGSLFSIPINTFGMFCFFLFSSMGMSTYMLVRFVQMRDPNFAIPYRLFGTSLIVALLLQYILPLFLYMAFNVNIYKVMIFAGLLPSVAAFFVYYRMLNYLKNNKEPEIKSININF